jgi:hypothetical protein
MFEVTKSILTPSQIMNVVSAYATSGESNVNYEEFLKILNRAGNMMGENQDEAGPHLINALRDQIHNRIAQMNQRDRDITTKLRDIAQ